MTRWARGGTANKKKPLEATGWSEMKSNSESSQTHVKQKNAKGLDSLLDKKKKKKNKKDKKLKGEVKSDNSVKPEKSAKSEKLVKPEKQKVVTTDSILDTLDNSDDDIATALQNSKESTHKVNKKTPQLLEYERKDRRREDRRIKRAEDRQKNRVCFNCRAPGHDMSACPEVARDVEQGTGICFKCGSTEHTVVQCKANVPPGRFPFAKCFICNEVGHLSRNCPDNPRGLYPNGGCCRICESVEHFKKDCPELQKQQGIEDMSLATLKQGTSLDDDQLIKIKPTNTIKNNKAKNKVVKF